MALPTKQINQLPVTTTPVASNGVASQAAGVGGKTWYSTIVNFVKSALLDEDTMASNSADQAPTQQSVKAYIDAQVATQIANIVEDTTPQLGGNLDVNGKTITSASNGHVEITPDGTGNVGIGTASPDGTLHVHTATAGSVTAYTAADDLVVEASGSGGMSLLTPDASPAGMYFGSPSDSTGASLDWTYDTRHLRIGTNTTSGALRLFSGDFVEALKIDSNQILEMDRTTADTPYFNFKATADGDTTSAISTHTTSGATTHHVQVDINGTKAWIAVSTNNPSA